MKQLPVTVKDWVTKAGLRAIVLFVHGSHHCGYVGVTKGHPLYGVPYSEPHPSLRREAIADKQIGKRGIFPFMLAGMRDETEAIAADLFFDVHGSLTFSDKGKEDGYLPDPTTWWFGYDCAHLGDQTLTNRDYVEGVFRDEAYCIAECESLAAQLEAVREVGVRSAI